VHVPEDNAHPDPRTVRAAAHAAERAVGLALLGLAIHWVAEAILPAAAGPVAANEGGAPPTILDPGRLKDALDFFVGAARGAAADAGGERHRTEAMCRALLETMLQMKLPKVRPKWLVNPTTKRSLELDMYNERHKLAFEYDGAQHDVFVPHFHANKYHFEYRRLLDKLKTELCRDAGVTLIRIPWKEVSRSDEVRTARYLQQLLYTNGIPYLPVLEDRAAG
jgi:hypothetical protein